MENQTKQKTLFSGIQPSGTLTLGNYIGALRNFPLMQDQYQCIYCIVDLHAITVRQDPSTLRKRCLELAAIYLACGLDPEKSLIYCQSHVSGHSELAWLLNCYTYMGELTRMTQFKDKSAKNESNINAGLFCYPVLMAADILLYNTDLVPVGADQKQHLELARNIAERFNGIYGNVFTVPDGYIPKLGSRIMSLSDPCKKMSKSDSEDSYIAILDEANIIAKKVKRAVTDSETRIYYDKENKPGVSNMLDIISVLSGKSIEDLVKEFDGKGYGYLKQYASECIINSLEPIQSEYKKLIADKAYIQSILKKNAEIANYLANKTMRKVHKKIGLAEIIK